MTEEILSNLNKYDDFNDIIKELLVLKNELKRNKIDYTKEIDIILNDEKISYMLELLVNEYAELTSNDKFIDELINMFRDRNKENDSEIIELVSNRNKDNKERIIKKFDNLVYKIAVKKTGQGLDIEDLIQEGRLGLLKAYDVYDIDRCTKFITVAVWWIRRYIQKALANQKRLIRLPMYLDERINKIISFRNMYFNRYGKEPSISEISKVLDIDETKIESILCLIRPTVSINYAIDSDNSFGSCILEEIIPDDKPGVEELADYELLKDDIKKAFKQAQLTEKEQKVIKMRYGIEIGYSMTLDEVGEKLKITRQGVKYVQEKAINKIISSGSCKILESYIDDTIAFVPKQNNLPGYVECGKSFASTFKGYNIANLENVVKELCPQHRELIYKKYGTKLDTNLNNWTNAESAMYYKTIRKEIISALVDKEEVFDNNTLLGRLKIRDINLLTYCIEGIYSEYKELLYKKYGNDLKGFNVLSREEEDFITKNIVPILSKRIRKVLDNKEIKPMRDCRTRRKKDKIEIRSIKNCEQLKEIVSTDSFKEYLLKNYIEDIIIYSLLFGYEDKFYDIDYIVDNYNKKRVDIIAGIINILTGYKEYIENSIDNTIKKPIKKILQIV